MKKRSVGRPKKKNAIQSGELNRELCRFAFIVNRKLVEAIKQIAEDDEVTIKAFMNGILTQVVADRKATAKKTVAVKKSVTHSAIPPRSASQKNKEKLNFYFESLGEDRTDYV